MRHNSTGQRASVPAIARLALLAFASAFALAACTTMEGTNAFTDIGTFEREVMTSTLQGVGILDQEVKKPTSERRAPLVLPKSTQALPPPQENVQVAALPENSDTVRIDTSGLSDEDIKRLRNAKVVDVHTVSGRPLTEVETRQLTARMSAYRLNTGPRPLHLPPEEYFTTIGGEEVVCLSKKGELVPVTHRDCPIEIKAAIGVTQPQSRGSLFTGQNRGQ